MYNKGGGGFKTPTEHVKGNSSNPTEVLNNSPQKPKRYGEDSLNKGLLGKKLRVTLVNGQTIEGILSNLGMYDLTISRKI
jgi:hypothetical protein